MRAGVADFVQFTEASLGTLRPPAPKGLVVMNAPYGKRVGAVGSSLPALYDALGRLLRGPFSAWRAAVLVEDRKLLPRIGADPRRAIRLENRGLRVWIGLR